LWVPISPNATSAAALTWESVENPQRRKTSIVKHALAARKDEISVATK
jgi:hypothetical protein